MLTIHEVQGMQYKI